MNTRNEVSQNILFTSIVQRSNIKGQRWLARLSLSMLVLSNCTKLCFQLNLKIDNSFELKCMSTCVQISLIYTFAALRTKVMTSKEYQICYMEFKK